MSRDPDNQLTTISLRSLKSDGMDSSETLLINAAGRIIQENIQHTSYVDQRGHADNNDYMTQSGPSYSDHNESLFVMQTDPFCKPSLNLTRSDKNSQIQEPSSSGLKSDNEQIVIYLEEGETSDIKLEKAEVEVLVRQNLAHVSIRSGRRSEVWDRFGSILVEGRRVKNYVGCVQCKKVYYYDNSHWYGTSTLKRHKCRAQTDKCDYLDVKIMTLQRVQPVEMNPVPVIVRTNTVQPVQEVTNDLQNFMDDDVQRTSATDVQGEDMPITPAEEEALEVEKKLVIFAAENLITGSLSKQKSFRDLIHSFIELSSTNSVGAVREILQRYDRLDNVLQVLSSEQHSLLLRKIKESGSLALSLHVDLCGSLAYVTMCASAISSARYSGLSYIPLRFVALANNGNIQENVKQFFYEAIESEGIADVRRVVITNLPELFERKLRTEKIVECVQTSLENVVNVILTGSGKLVTDQVEVARDIAVKVELLNLNSKLTRAIRNPGNKWLNILETLQAILENEAILRRHLKECYKEECFAGFSRESAEDILDFFQIFKDASSKLDLSIYPNSHSVFLWKHKLLQHSTPRLGDSEIKTELRLCAKTAIKNHFLVGKFYKMSTVLHPAFKSLRKMPIDPTERLEIFEELRLLCEDKISENTSVKGRKRTNEDFEEYLDSPMKAGNNEFDRYLSEEAKLVSTSGYQVLDHWRCRKDQYPGLYQIVTMLWALPTMAIPMPEQLKHCKRNESYIINMFTLYLSRKLDVCQNGWQCSTVVNSNDHLQ
ncbi:uncharacterized protein LOC136029458 isoform X1 [Artemia franciscana]|uniref:BED-type domain-containing protein n=2 Tax=Artemia franciscana TaxID=6661 RepID=A0AA88HI34_ARTSF|nr:hypothetical protein QYM36_015561 [Artemia franciscana]